MKTFVADNCKIEIDVDTPGIYRFESQSAIGKTFLCRALKKARGYGEKVDGYTYNDLTAGRGLAEYLMTQDLDVVLLDRYDMYLEKFQEEIKSLSERAVILVDCKSTDSFVWYADLCYLTFTDGLLRVDICSTE